MNSPIVRINNCDWSKNRIVVEVTTNTSSSLNRVWVFEFRESLMYMHSRIKIKVLIVSKRRIQKVA